MLNYFLIIIIFLIFWLICNYITRNLLKANLDDLAIGVVKYRKTIMFNILAMTFFFLLDFNFLLWIGIIYYIIISILEGILLVVSIVTGLDEDIKNRCFDINLWKVVLTKLLNELTSIGSIFFLFSLLN